MRERCEADIQTFAAHFFARHTRLAFGLMHRELMTLYRRSLRHADIASRPPRRLAIAAPRGSAKSTLKSLILPIHAVLTGRERYILILSATLKQAQLRLQNIRAEIQGNDVLRRFYPREIAQRESWTANGITLNDARIDAFSAGTELRGVSFRQWRPTLVLLDDIENSDTARNPERRDHLLGWYNEVVENIGDLYTAIEIVGTILHADSLLSRLLHRPDFETRIYRSIVRFAERDDLWEQWRSRYTNLDDADRAATARRFFDLHRAEMTRGTRVLWHAKENYYDLMCQLATLGRSAFFKEKQNEPDGNGEGLFNLGQIVRFRLENERILVK
jgi:hypothetical protein